MDTSTGWKLKYQSIDDCPYINCLILPLCKSLIISSYNDWIVKISPIDNVVRKMARNELLYRVVKYTILSNCSLFKGFYHSFISSFSPYQDKVSLSENVLIKAYGINNDYNLFR